MRRSCLLLAIVGASLNDIYHDSVSRKSWARTSFDRSYWCRTRQATDSRSHYRLSKKRRTVCVKHRSQSVVHAHKDILIEIFKNKIFAGSTMCSSDGRYSLDIDLLVGKNILTAHVYDCAQPRRTNFRIPSPSTLTIRQMSASSLRH